ncbi:MAG: DUF6033 family protein [Blautia sp.]|nr:DUF6033 family protein [Blautia sp.]
MSTAGNITSAYDAARSASAYTRTEESTKTTKTATAAKSGNYGNTIGDVQLSEKAAKYYEQLKSKNANMDFVLVSNDEVDGAEQKAAKFANSGRTLVLIDAEKLEKMAEDEDYRKKYESIIANAGSQLNAMADKLGSGTLANVKTFGIKVDDNGNASYFAVVDKSLSQQKDRIEKVREKRAEEKKEANKEASEARLEKSKEKNKTQTNKTSEQYETITASTVDELIKRLNDDYYANMSDNARTEQELQVGTQFDLRL